MSASLRLKVRSLLAELPRDYWLLWLGTLINRLGGFVAPFLALYLTGERGISVAQAAMVVALSGAGSFVAGIAGGDLSDRLGRRPVMLVSFLVTPVVIMVVGLVRTVGVIAVSTLFLGFFTNLYRPAVSAAIADIVPSPLRTRAYGYLYWAINLGAAIAPMVAGFVARWSYLPLFVADASTTLIYGLIVLWRMPETRPVGARAWASTMAGREPRRMRLIGREPLLLVFAGFSLLSSMVYAQCYSTLPVDMRAHHVGPALYGLAIAVNGLVIVLLGIPASRAAARWPRMGAMSTAALLTGIGFGMNGFFHSVGFYLLSVIVWTLGEIAAASVAPTIIADMAPDSLRGLYQGIYGSSWGLAFFIGPAAGGWILQHFGSRSLWSACLVLGALVAAGYLAMGRPAAKRMALAAEANGGGVAGGSEVAQ